MSDENLLTEEQIILIKEAFSMFDKDGNGIINTKELGCVLRSLGQNPTDEDITNILNEYDIDGDGIIDYSEFMTMMQRTSRIRETEQDQKAAFRVFDKDPEGYICLDELRFVLSHINETNPEEIEECLQFYDTENSGKLNFTNYMALMKPKDI